MRCSKARGARRRSHREVSVTVGEIRGTVQDLVGPHNGMRPLSAAMIDDHIHKACHTVFHEVLNWRSRATATINLVADDASYDLPADCLNILSVACVDTSGQRTRIRPIPFDERYRDYSGSSVGAYYVTQGSTAALMGLVLLPTPTASVTGGLTVEYRRRPAKLSTFDVGAEFTECDAALHLPLCNEAAWLFLAKQGSKPIKDFAGYHAYFESELANEKRRNQEEWQQDAIPVVNIQFGGLE